ncbi:hypothetical protein RB653_005890 [Dictyostelium firmibasis]|uniref:G-protein coupled receptors family 2 profile 2 domain-containing protein n=1 Tax=Dictyostelium firmibasis TaxID=79012 RepID=A0AAN7U8T9_9MYCE
MIQILLSTFISFVIIIVSSDSSIGISLDENDNYNKMNNFLLSTTNTSSSNDTMIKETESPNDYDFSKGQIESLDRIVYFSSSMGIVGALFIIVSFFLFKAARSFATKMIFFLSLSDLFAAIFYLPYYRDSDLMCNLQGMGLVFFLSSSYLWTMCISISLFMVFFTTIFELNHWFKYFHFICWGIPLFTAIISLIFHAYGKTGSWCFISDPTSIFRLLYYLPLIVVFFINLVVFIAIRWKISQHSNSLVSKVNIIVSFYLIAFSLSQLPTIINSIQNFSNPDDPQFSLFAFQLLLQPLQGFLNCVVYGINEGFIGHYVEFFEKYIFRCRCRKSRELKEIESDKTSLLVDYENSDDEEGFDGMDRLIIDDYNRV